MENLLAVLGRLEIAKDQIKPIVKTALTYEEADPFLLESNADIAQLGEWQNGEIALDGFFTLNQLIAIIRVHPSITSE